VAELVLDLRIVLAALILVLDQQRDRRARRLVLEHAGENLHGVRFTALGHEARLAGLAAVEPVLDPLGLQGDAGRRAIDHAADRRPMALAPGGEAEQMTEAVVRHDCPWGSGFSAR